MMAQVTLNVPNINCEHCERSVIAALSPLDGVQNVEVNIPQKQVRVEFNIAIGGIDQMKMILADEEYPVASVIASEG